MTVLACDIGKKGAFSLFKDDVLCDVIDMPLKKIEVKKEVRVFKNKDPKIVYKSGKSKGERPTKIKTPAKYKYEIDFDSIKRLFESQAHNSIMFISEAQFAIAHGKSIYQNYGKILGIALCYSSKMIEITPTQWQRHFGILKKDKEVSIKLAHQLFNNFTFTRHDQAESALIGKYLLDTLKTSV